VDRGKVKKITEKARKIKIFAMDVDGVLTDGRIAIYESGEELKFWNVKDRIAFFILKRLGYKTCWISGRNCTQVQNMAKDLLVDGVWLGVLQKVPVYKELKKKFKVRDEEILFIGDDLVDISILKKCGLSFCPSDACEEVKKVCDIVLKKKGGDGAFREAVEIVLKAKEQWKDVQKFYGF